MRHRTALASILGVVFSSLVAIQAEEFARLVRSGDQATLSVFGPRPVDLAAKQLVEEFGVVVNVEDPLYLYREDVQDVTPPRLANVGKRVLIPRASLLEMRVDLRPDGSLRDVSQVLADLAEAANRQLPFAYRVDHDGDAFTLVSTRTRDEQGRSIDLTPILDRHITIPPGTRRFYEHINLLTQALEEQTGVQISCCSALAESQPGPLIAFRAYDEPARSVFLRLLRSRPDRYHLSQDHHLVRSEPGGYYWHLSCQPGASEPPARAKAWCFINLAGMPNKR